MSGDADDDDDGHAELYRWVLEWSVCDGDDHTVGALVGKRETCCSSVGEKT